MSKTIEPFILHSLVADTQRHLASCTGGYVYFVLKLSRLAAIFISGGSEYQSLTLQYVKNFSAPDTYCKKPN